MLQLDLQQILSQAFSFLILLWILRRFAWRPLLQMLDARRARIEEELRLAAQARAELASLKDELNQRLAKIDAETRTRIQQAILEGRRIAMEIQEDARARAQGIVEKSKDAIALELAKAKVSLRDDLAVMAVEAMERILRQRCDTEADRHLVASIIEELGQSPQPTG